MVTAPLVENTCGANQGIEGIEAQSATLLTGMAMSVSETD